MNFFKKLFSWKKKESNSKDDNKEEIENPPDDIVEKKEKKNIIKSTPALNDHSSNCSIAAALKVSAAPIRTESP